jgi:acyl carrier protein
MNEILHERVREVVATTFDEDPQQISAEASNQTVASWTSLGHLRLMANLEQAFGVRFTMEEMTAMSSVQAIEDVLAARGVEV